MVQVLTGLDVPQFTPDVGLLAHRPYHLVFDYGQDLGFPKVSFALSVPKMMLWTKRKDNDKVTAVAMPVKSMPRAHIYGNLYLLNTSQVIRLDKHRQNGLHFRRKRVPLILPNFSPEAAANYSADLNHSSAWMYVGLPDHFRKPIDWDTGFFKGKGVFRVADIVEASNRQLQLPRHYRYHTPSKDPIPPISISIRSFEDQLNIKARDLREAEEEERMNRWYPKEEPKRNPVLHINSPKENEQSNPSKDTVSFLSVE